MHLHRAFRTTMKRTTTTKEAAEEMRVAEPRVRRTRKNIKLLQVAMGMAREKVAKLNKLRKDLNELDHLDLQ